MKILLVSETIPAPQLGGLAKHAVTLGNCLIDEGHEVVLMGLAGVDYEACRSEVGFRGAFVGALPAMAGWKEGPLGCFNPLKRPYFARQMASVISAHARRFDVVHYHGNLPLVGAFVPPDINFVQTRHDQGSECLVHVRYRGQDVCRELDPAACAACATRDPNAVQRWMSTRAVSLYRDLAAQAFSRHKTIFVSGAIRGNAGRVLPPRCLEGAAVVHNFVDQGRIQRAVAGIGAQGRVPGQVVIASRLDDAKGVGQFLQAWDPVRSGGSRLLLVGDGPLRADLQARYQKPGIEFLLHQPYERTLQLTAASHCAVVPSQCEEACSTTILEALHLGVPCLALRRGGNPELAAYEAWPGQLMLFDSVEELVDALRLELARPLDARPAGASQGRGASDVHAALPRILQIYER